MALQIVDRAEAAVQKNWRSVLRNPSSENVANLAGSSAKLIGASFFGMMASPFYGLVEGWKQGDKGITWQGFKKDPLYPIVEGPWNAIASTAKCAATIVGVVVAAPVVLAGVGGAAAFKSVKDNFFDPPISPASLAAAAAAAKAAASSPAISGPAISTPAVSGPAVATPTTSTPAVATSTPTTSTPTTSTPAASTPAVATPTTSTPAVATSTPTTSTPAASTPAVSTPAVKRSPDMAEARRAAREARILQNAKITVEQNNELVRGPVKPPVTPSTTLPTPPTAGRTP